MAYQPFRLRGETVTELTAPVYREFVHHNVLAPGLRMLLHRRRPDYPFPDTKFNPNTGQDYPPAAYEELFTWFLGRGSEMCSGYLSVLDSISGLDDRERSEARTMLQGFVRSQNEAILKILDENDGRIPFRVNRRFVGIDNAGKRIRLPADGCNASELFASKALLAGEDPMERSAGSALLRRFIDAAFRNGYEDDTAGYGSNLHAESPFMLSFAAFRYLVRLETSAEEKLELLRLAERMMDYVLSNFWDSAAHRFFEMIDFETRRRVPPFIPGHACELVGLGLQAITSLQQETLVATSPPLDPFASARIELSQILLTSFELGYDHRHGGIYQAVDPATGKVLNSDLSWWCLPEAMRAAVYALKSADDISVQPRLLKAFCTASNDYFTHYPNPDMYLFPFRTRSGETGEVKDFMPVVPEADPLYHSNLTFIDMFGVIDTM